MSLRIVDESCSATGTVEKDVLTLSGLTVTDPDILKEASNLKDPTAVGAMGQATLDLGVAARRLAHTEGDLRRVQEASEHFGRAVEHTVTEAIEAVSGAVDRAVDPDDGLIAEAVARELARVLDGLETAFDEDDRKSVIARIEKTTNDAVSARAAELIVSIRKIVDPGRDDSPIGLLRNSIVRDLQGPLDQLSKSVSQMEKQLGTERAVAEEARKGTAKGRKFEDLVGEVLTSIAAGYGDSLEPLGNTVGADGSKIGDFVLTVDESVAPVRVAFEAKDKKSLTATNAVRELDSAASNRDASSAVMVASESCKVTNGAPFAKLARGRYAVTLNRQSLDTLALRVVYQIARLEALASLNGDEASLDPAAVDEKIQEALTILDRISTVKRDLTSAAKGIDSARDHLDDMKSDLLNCLDDARSLLEG
ncbi:MAG: hypothetical protein GY720_13755 [bacterium]|nr:hypothetical protein [bacterium]